LRSRRFSAPADDLSGDTTSVFLWRCFVYRTAGAMNSADRASTGLLIGIGCIALLVGEIGVVAIRWWS
jgi:hypothetical protein